MTLSWKDNSEIVAGLVLAGKIAEHAVRPDLFADPYCDIIKAFQNGTREIETLIEMFGLAAVQPLLDARDTLSDTTQKANWVSLLENSCAAYQAGCDLEKVARKLKIGEPTDLSILTTISMKAQSGQTLRLVPASKITAQETAFIETGWLPIDEHLGGLPKTGLIVVGARPGTGKTWWAITQQYHFLKKHTDQYAALFSIEMPAEEVRERIDHMSKTPIPDDILDRWLIDDDVIDAEKIINRCSTIENLGIVVIDFADLIVKDINEPEYTKMYLTLAKGAKTLGCPIILLAQLSSSYQGGLPRPHTLRWTRLAEALAWMIIMLWNPSTDTFADDDTGEDNLPLIKDQAYCIVWKVRGGFKKHPDDNPGAILIPFRGESWHPTKSKWYSLTKEARTEKKRRGGRRDD